MPKGPQLPKLIAKISKLNLALARYAQTPEIMTDSAFSFFIFIIFNAVLLRCHMQKLIMEEKPLQGGRGGERGRELHRKVFST